MNDSKHDDQDKRPPVSFRFADRGDCALILEFIRKLAKYERMENDVVATENMISKWLFDKKAAEVLFAVLDGQEVGFALFFPNFSTFLGRSGMYLEDLFVLSEQRGKGIGKAMLRELARIAVSRGYGRFEWACLDWNAPSIEFYKSLGATPMDEWTIFRLSGDSLNNLVN